MRTVHAVDLVKPGAHVRAFALDRAMALAQKRFGRDAQFERTIDGERSEIDQRNPAHQR